MLYRHCGLPFATVRHLLDRGGAVLTEQPVLARAVILVLKKDILSRIPLLPICPDEWVRQEAFSAGQAARSKAGNTSPAGPRKV